MIPPFDDAGDLPPGLHTAAWAEFHTRFCRFVQSDRRPQLCQRLEQLVDDARDSGMVTRILIGGSMVRATVEPNDFDCIIVLRAETQYDTLRPDQLKVADARIARDRYMGDFFSHNRDGKIVGMIEVMV